MIYDQISLTQIIQQHAYDLKVQPIDLGDTDKHTGFSYFIFGKEKEDKDLQQKVDKALVKLQENGTMKNFLKNTLVAILLLERKK
ncbi:hypothetical protein AAFF39_09840 [Lactococcus garvieae]